MGIYTLFYFQLKDFQDRLEEVSCLEPYIGERMPLRWMKFEQEITSLTQSGANYASYDQVCAG